MSVAIPKREQNNLYCILIICLINLFHDKSIISILYHYSSFVLFDILYLIINPTQMTMDSHIISTDVYIIRVCIFRYKYIVFRCPKNILELVHRGSLSYVHKESSTNRCEHRKVKCYIISCCITMQTHVYTN